MASALIEKVEYWVYYSNTRSNYRHSVFSDIEGAKYYHHEKKQSYKHVKIELVEYIVRRTSVEV